MIRLDVNKENVEVEMSRTNNVSRGFHSSGGSFEIQYRKEGVFLIVNPPVGNGVKVDAETVLDKLSRKRVKGFNRDMVVLAVSESNGLPVRIADYQEEVMVDAAASVVVSSDKMKAYIVLSPPEGGKTITAEQMIEALSQQGVVYGINRSVIDELARHPVYNEKICVAEGKAPESGKDGKVQFYFDITKEHKPIILKDGRVNFRELNLIESVRKGQVLCSLIPPTKGIAGFSVLGTEVPARDGRPAKLPKGKNVEISSDGQALLASIDGQVVYDDGKVNVQANYEVAGDVDNSTGNIYFVGNVTIKGNVLSGFTVEAEGYVEVWGVVEGAVIKAGEDIILRRGMLGHGKGRLVSGRDIVARYIENSNIEAKNDIKAEAIMHSNVKCGNRLELTGGKGLLVGGTCKVGREIVAKVIGSHLFTATELEVGVNPELKERYRMLKEQIGGMETDIKKADQVIILLRRLEAAGSLPPEKKEILGKSIRTKAYLENKMNDLKEEAALLEEILQQESKAKVKVHNVIYPGVRVVMGTSIMHVKESLQYCTLYRDGADIKIGPINL